MTLEDAWTPKVPVAPSDVTVEAAGWRQGDVANLQRIGFVADLSNPTSRLAVEAVSRLAPLPTGRLYQTLSQKVEGVVVLTQTCDIVRSSIDKPYVEVCPLMLVDDGTVAMAARRELSQFVALPWHGTNSVADLDRIMTIEKGVLVGLEKLASCVSDEQLVEFQRVVVRRLQRFAFPDDFVAGMQKFRSKVKSKHGKSQSPEGRLFAKVFEIQVYPTPSWQAASYNVELTFILSARDLPPLPEELDNSPEVIDIRSWLDGRPKLTTTEIALKIEECQHGNPSVLSLLWHRLIESWIVQNVEPVGAFVGATSKVVNADEHSYSACLRNVPLDLEYLSD